MLIFQALFLDLYSYNKEMPSSLLDEILKNKDTGTLLPYLREPSSLLYHILSERGRTPTPPTFYETLSSENDVNEFSELTLVVTRNNALLQQSRTANTIN